MPASASQKKKASQTPDKKKQPSPVVDEDDKESAAEEGAGEEEEDKEYEIERIINAEKGMFGKGRWAFYVAWKGYGPDDNSWVDEKDFLATELIDQFWETHPEVQGNPKTKKKPRKSETSSSLPPSKTSKSRVRKTNVEVASSEEPANRPSKRKQGKEETDSGEDVEMEEEKPVAKKARKSKGKTEVSPPPLPENGATSEEADAWTNTSHDVQAMDKHLNLKSWENVVSQVDTVELQDKELLVYFTTKDGVKAISPSKVFYQKAPQAMLRFYESHLRWRQDQDLVRPQSGEEAEN